MSDVVIDLQKEALNNDCNILDLLRKAYLVARKLKLTEFEEWINHELNGYGTRDSIPDYRKVRGEVKGWNPYHGWIPVIIQDAKIGTALQERVCGDSISNLNHIYEKSDGRNVKMQFDTALNIDLSNFVEYTTKFALMIGVNQIYDILEKVRNIVLEWSITLEENGIRGEGLSFSEKEKEIAHSTSVINNYTNNFYGDVKDTQIQQDTTDSIQE